VLESIVKDVTIGRLVKIDEIVNALIFAIQNEAVTGTTLEITGGVISRGLMK